MGPITGPEKTHRLRLTGAQLAALVKLIDAALPYKHDARDRWQRAWKTAQKFKSLRELRDRLADPDARGRRVGRWYY